MIRVLTTNLTVGHKNATQETDHMRTWKLILAGAVAMVFAGPAAFPGGSAENWSVPASIEWPTVSGDWANTRYSTLSAVNASTVSKLGGVWMKKFDDAGAGRATPVVRDGLMFISAGSWVYAHNAKTGDVVWRYQSGVAQPNGIGSVDSKKNGSAYPGREGVAVGEGLVFTGLADGTVVALQEKTGAVAWSQYVGDNPPRKGQSANGAPIYANGAVFVGTAADFGFRGQVVALNAQNGHELWRWFAVPAPGESGSETWPKNKGSWQTGGGALWLVGAADPALGLVYFGTGNAVPQYGGDNRAGDNLYTCSIVALDIKTGKLRWHYQIIRHDIWEADIAMSPVLYDVEMGGRARKGIATMRADGYLFLLDRETGKPLMPVEERKVPQDARGKTAATQLFPVNASRVLPDCDEWRKQPVPAGFVLGCFFAPASLDVPNLLAPSWGMRTTPMTYSPQTGYIYAVGNASLAWFRRAEDPDFFGLGGNRVPGLPSGYSVLAALDTRTNTIAWKKEYRGGRPSGALATAGGLLFQMMSDGAFTALDAKTGDVLWQFQTGGAGGAGPASTYQIDGEQYVVIASRRNLWAFKLGGTIPPNATVRRAEEAATRELFTGPIQDVSDIEVASNVRDMGVTGSHYMTDEYAFSVYRARVKAGSSVRWTNNGRLVHTVTAEDGSWTTGSLNPIQVGVVKFDKPGTYTYFCKDHPWARAQLLVVP